MTITENNFYYPFTAIVGQKPMKSALILNAINPQIGRVLINGTGSDARGGDAGRVMLCPNNMICLRQ